MKEQTDGLLLAIDIGGSKFITGLMDTDGNILYSERREWDGLTQDDVQRQIIEGLRDTQAKNPELFARVKAGGVKMCIRDSRHPAAACWWRSRQDGWSWSARSCCGTPQLPPG